MVSALRRLERAQQSASQPASRWGACNAGWNPFIFSRRGKILQSPSFGDGGRDVALSQSGTGSYTAIDLHPSGFTTSQALGISDGQQVGMGRGPSSGGQTHALLWSGTAGSVVDLHPSGFILSEARSTSGGQQVGIGVPASGGSHALLWRGTAGSVVDLHPSGFATSTGTSTSGNQQLGWKQVGYGFPPGPPGTGGHALLWSGSAGSVVDLNPSGFIDSIAYGVSGGQQVGAGRPTSGDPEHARLWSGSAGSVMDLHPSGFDASNAFGISGGQQVGYAAGPTTAGGGHALLWSGSAGSAVDLHPSGFIASQALGTNGTQQVGFGVVGGHNHALVWSGDAGKVVDLHQFLPQGFTDSQAKGIDSTGNIAGWAFDGSNYHAFLWTTGTFWGVDSLDIVDQTFFDAVKQAGNMPPAFWGRYIGKTGNLTPGEVALLHRNNCKVLVIYRDTTLGQLKSKARGRQQAKAAIKAAQSLGIPSGVWIYADTEFPDQSPTAEWFAGWFETLQSSPYGAGVYGNTSPGAAPKFGNEFCKAYPHFPNPATAYVYTNQPEPGCNFKYRTFNPAMLQCNPLTVIQQYAIECTVPNTGGRRVDLDLANAAGFASMW